MSITAVMVLHYFCYTLFFYCLFSPFFLGNFAPVQCKEKNDWFDVKGFGKSRETTVKLCMNFHFTSPLWHKLTVD